MFGKRTRLVTMVAASAAIPYAWYNESISGPVRNTFNTLKESVSSPSSSAAYRPTGAAGFGAPDTRGGPHRSDGTPLTSPYLPLAAVLRFDVTPRWVTQQWPRVSTVHAKSELIGFRVPLVTGIERHDVTGALTYFFDAHQRLQRITLQGQTGDERQLTALASRFGLKTEPSLTAGMLLARWNGRPINVLRIVHAPVIRADEPTAKYLVDLELNDPTTPYGLSPETAQMLEHDALVKRWDG